MVLPGRYSQGTPGWYSDPTLPDFEKYADNPAAYDAAVAAWSAQHNGGPAGTAPGYDPVTGMNYAGSQRMADMSQGEYAANYLNNRMASAAGHVNTGNADHPNAKMFQLAMLSRMQNRPEEFQAAYGASTPGLSGPTPILNDTLLNFLEANGYAPTPPPPPTGLQGGPDNIGKVPTGQFTPPDFVPRPGQGGDMRWKQPTPTPPGGDFVNRNPGLPGQIPGQAPPGLIELPPSPPIDFESLPPFIDDPRMLTGQIPGGGPQSGDFDPGYLRNEHERRLAQLGDMGLVGGNPGTQARFEQFKQRYQQPFQPTSGWLQSGGY